MMFLINPVFSLVALTTIVGIYSWLTRKELASPGGDIRGGLFLALAERASRLAEKFPRHQVAWKPDLLVPVEDPDVWAGSLYFIRNITYPSGSIFAFTITPNKALEQEQKEAALNELLLPLKDQGILVNSTVIEDESFLHGAKSVIQTLRSGAFRPNTLFLTVGGEDGPAASQNSSLLQDLTKRLKKPPPKNDTINQLVLLTLKHKMGVALLRQHSRMAFGMQKDVNLWLRDKSPNWHLAMLLALQIQLNWDGKINLVTVGDTEEDTGRLYHFLEQLSDQARLSSLTDFYVLPGSFKEALCKAPKADINIFGLSVENEVPLDFIREVSELVKSSCVFVIDSGYESALA